MAKQDSSVIDKQYDAGHGTFGEIVNGEQVGSQQDYDNSRRDDPSKQVSDQEQKTTGWANKTSPNNAPPTYKLADRIDKLKNFNLKSFANKRKMPIIVITVVAFMLGIPIASLPLLAPLSMFENISNDLNDMLHSRDIRTFKMTNNKLATPEREKALTACGTVITVFCKFASVSPKQIEKLKSAGIEISEKDTRFKIGNRVVPKTYKFMGSEYTAAEWSKQLRENPNAIRAQRVANNVRYSTVSDKAFMSRVYRHFGVTKSPPEISGKTAEERVTALLNKANPNNTEKPTFVRAVDDKGNDIPDKNGSTPSYTLEGDTNDPKTIYSQKEVDKMNSDYDRVFGKKNSVISESSKNVAIGALSIVGYWDLACSIKNMIGTATVAAKVLSKIHLVQYVAPIASLAYKIKAGDATVEDAETVGKLLNDTDNRKQIDAYDQVKVDSQGNVIGNIPKIDNPDYGKSAMDSSLLSMSINGGVAKSSNSTKTLSLGFGASDILAGFAGGAAVLSDIVNIGTAKSNSPKACDIIQSWWARGIGIVGSVLALIASGGTVTGAQVAVAGAMLAGMFVIEAALNVALSGNLVETANLSVNTVARGEAIWTGLAAMLSTGAQANGMMPGSADQIVAYQAEQQSTIASYNEIDRATVKNQFDITNQYSVLGSISRSIASILPSSSVTLGDFSNSLLKIPQIGFAGILKLPSASAASLNPDRFKQCSDTAYQDIGIDADVQCNIRYVMPEKDLNLDTGEVALYMEKFVNPETGLPDDFVDPNQSGQQNLVESFVTGVTSQFTPPTLKSKYAMFLENCAYRSMPYGETFTENIAPGTREWLTGEKCRDTTDIDMSYFRAYTMDMAINSDMDDDYQEELTNSVTSPGGNGNTTSAKPISTTSPECDLTKIPVGAEPYYFCWRLKDNTDHSNVACATGTEDVGINFNQANGVKIRVCKLKGVKIASVISQSALDMVTAAAKDGVNLTLSSGLRTYEEQIAVRRTNCGGDLTSPAKACSPPTARPGESNHEKGTAIDWGNNGKTLCFPNASCAVGSNVAYDWLTKNASKYGFFRLPTEAWHWSTDGA